MSGVGEQFARFPGKMHRTVGRGYRLRVVVGGGVSVCTGAAVSGGVGGGIGGGVDGAVEVLLEVELLLELLVLAEVLMGVELLVCCWC